ncbi:MAG: hypothetical protein ACK481_06020 [Candidatus Melainabacteria bacterium]|jgi:hypothetical protein
MNLASTQTIPSSGQSASLAGLINQIKDGEAKKKQAVKSKGKNNIVVLNGKTTQRTRKKKDDEVSQGGLSQSSQNATTSIPPTQSPSSSLVNAFANPAIATPTTIAISSLLALAPVGITKISNQFIDRKYSEDFAQKLLSKELFSDKELAEIYDKAVSFLLNPDKIKMSKRLRSMYNNKKQLEDGEKEYRKLVLGTCRIIVSGKLPVLNWDGDGFQLFKNQNFVSATAPTEANVDRSNIATTALFLRRFKSFIKPYNQSTGANVDPKDIALYKFLTMRAGAWDGRSYRRIPRTPFWEKAADGSWAVGIHKEDAIDSTMAELGLGPEYEHPLVEAISYLGLGGVVDIKNGGQIHYKKPGDSKINGDKTQGRKFMRSVNETWEKLQSVSSDQSTVNHHLERLSKLSGEEFLKEYEKYVKDGQYKDIHLGGLIGELALLTKKAGINVLEVKMVPEYTISEEWDHSGEEPTLKNDFGMRYYLNEALDLKAEGKEWKSFLLDKFRPLSNNSYDKSRIPVTSRLWNKLTNSNDLHSIVKEFTLGAVFNSVSHAIDGINAMVNPDSPTYDYYKDLLRNLYKKYANAPEVLEHLSQLGQGYEALFEEIKDGKQVKKGIFKMADNGVKAPYIEFSGYFAKDAFERSPWGTVVAGGDSQSTDLIMILEAIDQAYEEREKAIESFQASKEFLSGIGKWKYTAAEEAKMLQIIQEDGLALGKKARGQIDLFNDKAKEHMLTCALKDGASAGYGSRPFAVKQNGDQYELVGPEYSDQYKGKIVSKEELYKIFEKVASPWYDARISTAPDVHQNNQQMAEVWHSLMGVDTDKLNTNILAEAIIGRNNTDRKWGASLLMPYHKWHDQLRETLEIKSPKGVFDLPTTFIRRAPEIGGTLGLAGAVLAMIGVAGEVYDNVAHDNKFDQSFRDMVAKAFSLSNLGLAITTAFVKPIFWPFQVLGSLLGISSGFLPSGRLQQYVALGSMAAWLFGSAREMGHDQCTFLDTPKAQDEAERKAEFTVENDFLQSGFEGKKTNYDIKGILTHRNRESSKLMGDLVEKKGWLPLFAKPFADLSWNINAFKDVIRDPKLLKLDNLVSVVNGFKYEPAPHSMPHLINMGGWISVGLLGATAAIQAISHFTKKDQEDGKTSSTANSAEETPSELQKISQKMKARGVKNGRTPAPSSRTLLDPRVTSKQKIAIENSGLDKAASAVGSLSALIPALVFILQGWLRSQNATGSRLFWATETGAQRWYRPDVLGKGLMISAGLQAASALGVTAGALGAYGSNTNVVGVVQSMNYLGAALALAFQSIGIKEGDAIGFIRDRLSLMPDGKGGYRPNSYMGDPLECHAVLSERKRANA